MEYVQEAARLGGANTFIEKLPEQYHTYLERPVKDYYSGLPEGTTRYVWSFSSYFYPYSINAIQHLWAGGGLWSR